MSYLIQLAIYITSIHNYFSRIMHKKNMPNPRVFMANDELVIQSNMVIMHQINLYLGNCPVIAQDRGQIAITLPQKLVIY